MVVYPEDIKKNILIAKAIEEDLSEAKSYDVEAAYAKSRKRIEASARRYRLMSYLPRIAAVLLILLSLSTGVLSYLYVGRMREGGAIAYVEASSAPGVVSRVMLPDSSLVWLNAESALRYPTRFDERERRVWLRGEGYFQVRSDKEHPFYVSLDNEVSVKAYGTQFNISAYEGDPSLEATLATGIVDVLLASSRVATLRPSEQAVYDKAEGRFSVKAVSVEEKTAWKDGRLVFRNAPIEEVFKRLERRYNVEIVLHEKIKADYKLRATFSSETITQIMEYLSMSVPMRWEAKRPELREDHTFGRQRIDVWLR